MTTPPDGLAVMRSKAYLGVLVFAVVLGVPVAALAYGFLKLTSLVQQWTFTDLPKALGHATAPMWWPLLPLTAAGILVALSIRLLPGSGGESPAAGFGGLGVTTREKLPGIFCAALASIGLGAVIGPEMPLIALGGGLAYLAVTLVRRDLPPRAAALISAAGSFAAISTLLGTPLAGAFLLLEASSIGGTLATAALLPGLLASGVGALVFTGLDSLTGFGTFSLAIPDLPAVGSPTIAEFGWAIVMGLVAAPVCIALRRGAGALGVLVGAHRLLVTTALGLGMAGLAIGYAAATGHGVSDVLFSGQDQLPGLVADSAQYSVGALLLLLLCKGLAYTGALSAFRGGPTFPAMFLGAVGGIALSHLPGLPLVPAIAMGLGAMTAAMLRLPMTAVLVTSLFLGSDGFPVIPLTIVAAVVAYVAENWLTPAPAASPQELSDDGGKRVPDLPPPRAGETPVDASSPPGRRAQGLS
jgi:H+/Cl- antiporter ClcA